MRENDLEKEKEQREEGWRPTDETSAETALKTEERSLDVGESGQHAPGGYFNQQGVNAPDRSTLDEE